MFNKTLALALMAVAVSAQTCAEDCAASKDDCASASKKDAASCAEKADSDE